MDKNLEKALNEYLKTHDDITLCEEWYPAEENKEIVAFIKSKKDVVERKGWIDNVFVDDTVHLMLSLDNYFREIYKDHDLNMMYDKLFESFPEWDDGGKRRGASHERWYKHQFQKYTHSFRSP